MRERCPDPVAGEGSGLAPVAAIIPAWNEEQRIQTTVQALWAIPAVKEIIVVDDGSQDTTGLRARAAGGCVLRLSRRQGKAAAVRRGLAHTRAPIVLLVDADTGASAIHAEALLAPILAGAADMTIGRLPGRRRGGLGVLIGTSRWALRRLTGANLTQPLSGQRALRREALAAVTTWGWGYGLEVALSTQIIRAGFVVQEVETGFTHRVTGFTLSGWFHRTRQLAHVWTTLFILALRGRS